MKQTSFLSQGRKPGMNLPLLDQTREKYADTPSNSEAQGLSDVK